jgi:hypothetical protein
MLKPLLKILVAGTVGFLSIMAGYLVLGLHNGWLPVGVSNTTLIAVLLIPIPTGLLIAWAVYRGLDRITGPNFKQPR